MIAAVQGCTFIKLAYNTAPDVMYFWMDSYVDFTSEQATQVKEELASYQAWHRSKELPKYIGTLQRIEQAMPQNVDAKKVCDFYAEVRTHYETLALEAEPAVSKIAESLTPDQLANLRKKYEKSNEKYRKEWMDVSPEKVREKRLKEIVDRAENVYGNLTREQKDAIRAEIDKSSFDPGVFYAERLRRQEDALTVLKRVQAEKLTAAQAKPLIHDYLMRAVAPSSSTLYGKYQDKVEAEGCRSFAVAHNSTTVDQRDKAVKRLRAYEQSLRELSAKS